MKARFVLNDTDSDAMHPAIQLVPENDGEQRLLEWFTQLIGGKDRFVVPVPIGIGSGIELGIMLNKDAKTSQDKPSCYVMKVVPWFGTQMIRKLLEHQDRPGWKGESYVYLLTRLSEERVELERAVADISDPSDAAGYQKIIDEAADVANMALMIADNAASMLDKLKVK